MELFSNEAQFFALALSGLGLSALIRLNRWFE